MDFAIPSARQWLYPPLPSQQPVPQRYETPPTTEQEWEEALSIYGRDRDIWKDSHRPAFHRSLSTENMANLDPETSKTRPLIPQLDAEGDDALYFQQTMGKDWNGESSSKVTAQAIQKVPSSSENGRLSPCGSEHHSQASSFNDANGSLPVFPGAPGQATSCGISGPDWSAAEERARMRRHYEKEGYLPAPIPGEIARLRKKRAIIRLGFLEHSDPESAKERASVIAKYAEMARDMFGTSRSTVSILGCHEQIMFTENPDKPVEISPLAESVCFHTLRYSDLECAVIPDITKDWRFKNNPCVARLKTKFYAAAPLRYRWGGHDVDIGTLVLLNDTPREEFTQMDSKMLLNLANMLTYQLASLQAQLASRRSSSMYQQGIQFLRRAVTAEKAVEDKTEKTSKPKKRQSTLRPLGNGGLVAGSSIKGSQLAQEEDTNVVVKSGPRESRKSKIAAESAEKKLFTDMAETLRGVLRADHVAVVDLADFTFYLKRDHKSSTKTKEQLIMQFLQGKAWPADCEPVIHYRVRSTDNGLKVLGESGGDMKVDFSHGVDVVQDVLQQWAKHRAFWWDREDPNNVIGSRLAALLPQEVHTTVATAFLTSDGRMRFAMFASWKSPPSTIGDSNLTGLPFTWIIGGYTMAALAIRKVRSQEASQISYSNLQAHELRTPLHQILAVTQLLRSAMIDLAETPRSMSDGCMTTTEQVRDLLPLLDAIDTSGKTLHGIVDNILSFLDLAGADNMVNPTTPALMDSPTGLTASIEDMFEDLINEADEEDRKSREANNQPLSNVETVFEVLSPELREVTEDSGGALRKAIGKILSNAYKFIDGNGQVEIYLDGAQEDCPQGCEELTPTKRVSIRIIDNGKGMDSTFVRDKLGEAWAKEDTFATGSGLSVHLAYRIIDLLGGTMDISSAPGQGTSVSIEVPLPRRPSPSSPVPDRRESVITLRPALPTYKRVALMGFDKAHSVPLRDALSRQLRRARCEIVDASIADLIIVDGAIEEYANGTKVLNSSKGDLVFFIGHDHMPHPSNNLVGRSIRRFKKPITPSKVKEAITPGSTSSKPFVPITKRGSIDAQSTSSSHSNLSDHVKAITQKTRFSESPLVASKPKDTTDCPIVARLCSFWKPKSSTVEDAVASLSLGDYIHSHRRSTLSRTPSLGDGSSGHSSSTPLANSLPGTPPHDIERDPLEVATSSEGVSPIEIEPEEPVPIKVMVVEDNRINRKILVKILSSKTPIEIIEAEDGLEAVQKFKTLTGPSIVLMDINMPKMDGFQAATEMRALEQQMAREKSHIIAVTAMAGEAEKHRGLVECGMDSWMTKPCGKAAIHKAIDLAKENLGNVKA